MESYTYQLMRKIEDRHWWFVARRKIIEATLQRLKLPAKAEILEVGCGTGGNIGMLNRFGITTCIEQDPAAAEMARERQQERALLPQCGQAHGSSGRVRQRQVRRR